MNLKPALEQKYPQGSRGGQCFTFLHNLAEFPPVGDSLEEKKRAFRNYGQGINDFSKNFRLGDILLTDESQKNGHGGMIVARPTGQLQLIESNFSLNGKVNLSRTISPASPKILAVLRPETFKFAFPPVQFPIQPRVKILFNKSPVWPSALQRIPELQNWFWEKSGHKIELIIDVKSTNISGWPTVMSGGGLDYLTEIIEEGWFNAQILPEGDGADIVIFVMRRQDWQGQVNSPTPLTDFGYCYEPSFPIKIFLAMDEAEGDKYPPAMPGLFGLSKWAAHEIGHGLYGIASSPRLAMGSDFCHPHFYGDANHERKFENIFNDFDYFALSEVIKPN